MNMIEALALYCLEIVRYIIGSKVLFKKSLKRRWISLAFGVLYSGILVFHPEILDYSLLNIMAYLFAAFAASLMMEGKLKKRLFQVILLFCLFSSLDQAIGSGIFYIFGEEKFSLSERCILESLTVIVFLSILYLVFRVFDRYKGHRNYVEQESIYIVVLILSFFLMISICGISLIQMNVTEIKINEAVWEFILYICIAGIISFLLYINRVNNQRIRLIQTQQMLNDMQKEYYQSLLEKEKETKKYRHDMNGHLMYLHELVKGNEKAEVYIAELQGNLSEIKRKCYFTGNENLDILLNHHLSSYNKAKVSVIGKCKYQPEISDVDFCSIFSNLIKNAIEGVERESFKEKYIRVNLKSGKEYLEIEINNSSSMLIDKKDTQIKTKKEDAKNHGMGLLNVRETIEKNGGNFTLFGDGKEVTAKVILKIKN